MGLGNRKARLLFCCFFPRSFLCCKPLNFEAFSNTIQNPFLKLLDLVLCLLFVLRSLDLTCLLFVGASSSVLSLARSSVCLFSVLLDLTELLKKL